MLESIVFQSELIDFARKWKILNIQLISEDGKNQVSLYRNRNDGNKITLTEQTKYEKVIDLNKQEED